MESVLTKSQKLNQFAHYSEDGRDYEIIANIRYDDACGNGHNTFSITGSIHEKGRQGDFLKEPITCGCIHEDIAKHFPHLAKYIKWHLVSSDAPLHYIANTLYHAGNRDYNGLLAGERRQIKNGGTGLPAWHLVAVNAAGDEIDLYKVNKNIDAAEKPYCPYTLEYRPWCIEGEGKERDLAAARESAVWPEATDEQLSLPRDELEEILIARHPKLQADFAAAMVELGFTF